MDLWTDIEKRIRAHGVRVDERLDLLTRLRTSHESGDDSVVAHLEALESEVEGKSDRLKKVLRQ